MSFNFGQDKQSSVSDSSGTARTNQDIWAAQSPYLRNLFAGSQSLFGRQNAQVPGAAQRFAGEGMRAARFGVGQMENIARTGGQIGQYAQPNNELAQRQLADMSTNIGNEFSRVVMPQLNSDAGLAGGLGGSRNALGRGLAASDAQRQISQAGTDLYAHQYDIGAQAAAGATQARLEAAGGLGDAGAQIYNLGMSPFTAQWAPMMALQQMLGGPSVLTQSQSQQTSHSEGKGKSTKFGFGF